MILTLLKFLCRLYVLLLPLIVIPLAAVSFSEKRAIEFSISWVTYQIFELALPEQTWVAQPALITIGLYLGMYLPNFLSAYYIAATGTIGFSLYIFEGVQLARATMFASSRLSSRLATHRELVMTVMLSFFVATVAIAARLFYSAFSDPNLPTSLACLTTGLITVLVFAPLLFIRLGVTFAISDVGALLLLGAVLLQLSVSSVSLSELHTQQPSSLFSRLHSLLPTNITLPFAAVLQILLFAAAVLSCFVDLEPDDFERELKGQQLLFARSFASFVPLFLSLVYPVSVLRFIAGCSALAEHYSLAAHWRLAEALVAAVYFVWQTTKPQDG